MGLVPSSFEFKGLAWNAACVGLFYIYEWGEGGGELDKEADVRSSVSQ